MIIDDLLVAIRSVKSRLRDAMESTDSIKVYQLGGDLIALESLLVSEVERMREKEAS